MFFPVKDTKDRIVQQALVYFTSHDYDRTSLNDIAEALNITKGGIYYYFDSKDDLFRTALQFALSQIGEQFGSLLRYEESVPFRDLLKRWFDLEEMGNSTAEATGIDVYREYENIIYILYTALKKFPDVRSRIGELYEALIAGLQQLLEKGRDHGEIRSDLDIEALAFELVSLGEGSMLIGSLLPNLPHGTMMDRTFENFWGRIQA